MRDSDWSRPNLLRSDWLPIIVAICTTFEPFLTDFEEVLRFLHLGEGGGGFVENEDHGQFHW